MIPEEAEELILQNKLPENTVIEGCLNLENYTNIQSLTDNLIIKGNLNLRYCINLQSLSKNLTIEDSIYLGWLDLRYCASLKSLSENLIIQSSLYCDDELIERINPTKYKHIKFYNQILFNERLKEYEKIQSLKDNKYRFISKKYIYNIL